MRCARVETREHETKTSMEIRKIPGNYRPLDWSIRSSFFANVSPQQAIMYGALGGDIFRDTLPF